MNGKSISMIVDTGASTIVLTPEDAKAAGIDIDGLTYRVPVITANGRTVAARVRLKEVAIGPLDRKRGRRAGRPARRAHPEPARYEFLKPPALL